MLPAGTLQFCDSHQFFKVMLPSPSDYTSVLQKWRAQSNMCIMDLHLFKHTEVHGALSARPTAEINSNIATTHCSTLQIPWASKLCS